MTIPLRTLESLQRYRDHHLQPGGFLRAVLSNNLMRAIDCADQGNLAALPEIIRWCYTELPWNSWMTPAKVRDWLAQRVGMVPSVPPLS